jgi:fatty acid desaturase
MSRVLSFFTAHPSQLFRRSPRFYMAYDASWAAFCGAAIALKLAFGFPALFGAPSWAWAAAFPFAVYAVILAQLSIHNAVHGNFPRAINRVVGEVLGLVVVVRFASWVMVHLRHHRFADDRVHDPHPNFPSFWRTALHTIVQVEKQLMREYYELWGDTEDNRSAEARRAKVSYGTNIVLLAAWALYLGPAFFALVFLPANVLGALFIIHFNWVTHAGPRGDAFRPVNLNHGWFWLGNKLFAGIYMHKNHHERPHLANPAAWRAEKFGPEEPCADAAVER